MNAHQIITVERLRLLGYGVVFVRQFKDGVAIVAAPCKLSSNVLRLLVRPDGTYHQAGVRDNATV